MEGVIVKQYLKDRIIEQFERMSPGDKRIFLQLLKFKPGEIAQIVSHIHSSRGMIFTVSRRGAPMIDHKRDSQELLKELHVHFADEMAGVTR